MSTNTSDTTVGISRECIECDGPFCTKKAPEKRCSRCRTEYYCSIECQKAAWKDHKKYCIPIDRMRLQLAGINQVTVAPEDTTAFNSECGICLEDTIENPIVLQDCHHAFCSKCLIQWQSKKQMENMHQSRSGLPCPICRAETVEDVEQALIERAMLLGSRASSRKIKDEGEKSALWNEALECIEKVLGADDFSIQAFFTKAEALIALHRESEAIEVLNEMIEEDNRRKEHPVLKLIEQEELARANGNFDEAQRLKEEVVAKFDEVGVPSTRLKGHTDVYLLQCTAYESKGSWKEAADLYVKLMESMDNDFESTTAVQQRKVFMGMAQCMYELGKYERAIAASEAAMSMNRHFPGVHKIKALAEKAMGDIDAAITTMNRAVLYETPWDDDHKLEVLEFYKEICAEKNRG